MALTVTEKIASVESSMQAPAEEMKCDVCASVVLCCAPQCMFPLYTAVAIVRSNASSTACRMRAVVDRASTLAFLQLLLITSTRISRWTNPYPVPSNPIPVFLRAEGPKIRPKITEMCRGTSAHFAPSIYTVSNSNGKSQREYASNGAGVDFRKTTSMST